MATLTDMITIKAVLSAHQGRYEDAKAAATDLWGKTLGKRGIIAYQFYADDARQQIQVIEMYEDSDAMLNHIATASFDQLLGAVGIEVIELLGDPSEELVVKLKSFDAPLSVFPTLCHP